MLAVRNSPLELLRIISVATNKQVAEAFVRGVEARSATMHSNGHRLFSYDLQIAHRLADCMVKPGELNIVLDYDQRAGHTMTTQGHMRELERAMGRG